MVIYGKKGFQFLLKVLR